jgi:hypothetical protein
VNDEGSVVNHTYEAPRLAVIGSVEDLTQGNGPGQIDAGGSTAEVP